MQIFNSQTGIHHPTLENQQIIRCFHQLIEPFNMTTRYVGGTVILTDGNKNYYMVYKSSIHQNPQYIIICFIGNKSYIIYKDWQNNQQLYKIPFNQINKTNFDELFMQALIVVHPVVYPSDFESESEIVADADYGLSALMRMFR